MPELPEVETVARGLAPLVGQRLREVTVRRTDLRRPVPQQALAALVGQPLVAVRRRAKYLLMHFAHDQVLRWHLGMSGRLYFVASPELSWQAHEHLQLSFERHTLRYRDARRFGACESLSLSECHQWERTLAPEPWDESLTPQCLMAQAQRHRRVSLKALLLSGLLMVGVGNIYASEALFAAGLDPRRTAGSMTLEEWAKLLIAVREVLAQAIAAGGTSLKDYITATGETGYFQVQLAVYGRAGAPCPRCASPIERLVQAGRSTFFCPVCQK